MPKRNRLDYIDNTIHVSNDLDKAQREWYSKVKNNPLLQGNQDLGKVIYGPKPGDKKNTTMAKYKERIHPREDSTESLLGYDEMAASISGSANIDSRGYDFKPFDNTKLNSKSSNQYGNLVSPDYFPSNKNNFIPPATQDSWANKWDVQETQENFITAREQGSNPPPNPPDTTIDIDREGTMNNLFRY